MGLRKIFQGISRVAENPAVEREAAMLEREALEAAQRKAPMWENGAPVAESGTVIGESHPISEPSISEAPTVTSQEIPAGEEVTKLSNSDSWGGEPVAGTEDIKRNAMYEWVKNNPSKAAAAGIAGGAGLIGLSQMGGGSPPPSAPIAAPLPASAPIEAPKAPVEVHVHTAPAPQEHKTSGVKPISEEVHAAGTPVASTLQESSPQTINTVENMQAAIDQKNHGELANRLGRASELIGTGFSHAQPVAQEAFNEQIKGAGSAVKDFEEVAAQEKNDPKSQVSKDFREYLQQFGMTVPPGTSATSAQKIMPYAYQKFAASEAQKSRHEENKLKYEQLKAYKEAGNAAKEASVKEKSDADAEKQFTKFGEKIESGLASSRSPLGRTRIVQQRGEAVQALIDQVKNQKGGPDSRQMQEIARSMDAMLSGGVGTITGTQELIPHTLRGKFASLEEYIANKPSGLENKEFLNRVEDTIKRETALSKRQQADIMKGVQSAYSHLSKKDPERFQQVLEEKGLVPSQNPLADQAPPPNDLVSVITPDGRKGKIPKANLEKALAGGYKVAE